MTDILTETQTILARAIKLDTDPALARAMKQILAAAQTNRWQRYDDYGLSLIPATDQDTDRLRDMHPACQNHAACGPGWFDLLHATFVVISEKCPGAEWWTTDIKEKFGALRVYWSGDLPDDGDLVLDAAESLSEHVCEECGAPGSTREGGWIRTLCDQHHQEQKR